LGNKKYKNYKYQFFCTENKEGKSLLPDMNMISSQFKTATTQNVQL